MAGARRREIGNHETVHGWAEQQAAKTPDRIALVCDGQALTYHELNGKANQLARVLRAAGAGPGSIVGIMVRRSLDLIVAMLATLKAGAAYLPLDPEYPPERVRYMLEDSRTEVLLAQPAVLDAGESCKRVIDVTDDSTYSADDSNLPPLATSGDLAYVIYTSGSTGRPKGVMIEHQAVLNFIEGITALINFDPQKTIVALTTVCFDIFVLETLLPLTKGLRIVVATEQEQRDPEALHRLLSSYGVHMLQATPSRMQWLLSDAGCADSLCQLTEIMVGGEAFSETLLQSLRSMTNGRIYNMYGPTETTVWSAVKDLTESRTVTVGRPIRDTRFLVIDEQRHLAPAGVVGELWIAGSGLARGYLFHPDLTAERFVPDPSGGPGRMYRTGDLARHVPNGEYEVLGRVDHQVKIGGYRIELGEIEAAILHHAGVHTATVVAKGQDGDKHLCAYIVTTSPVTSTDLKQFLAQRLPHYMVPSQFISLDRMPLTPNGKVDRIALLTPRYPEGSGVIEADPLKYLCMQVADLSGHKSVAGEDNLFDLGINSLDVLRILAAIKSRFGVAIPLRVFLRSESLAEAASFIVQQSNARAGTKGEVAICSERPAACNFSPAQHCYVAVCMPYGNTSACNIATHFKLGPVEPWEFINAVKEVVARHHSLRSVFYQDNSQFRQHFLDGPLPLHRAVEIEEMDDLPPVKRKLRAERTLAELSATVMPLDQWPLFRIRLLRMAPEANEVLLVVHHLVSDGYSLNLFQHEIQEFITAAREGRAAILPPILTSYRQFSLQQAHLRETSAYEADRKYWLGRFAEQLEMTAFPATGLGVDGGRGSAFLSPLPRPPVNQLRTVCRALRCSQFTFLLTIYLALIGEALHNDNVSISIPTAGRYDAEHLHVIGLFATLGLVTNRLSPRTRLSDMVRETDEQLIGMHTHVAYQYQDLLRDLGIASQQERFPITSVMFNEENLPIPVETYIREATSRHRDLGRKIRFDLQALIRSDREDAAVEFIYRTDVLTADLVERLAGRYTQLVERAVADPGLALGQLLLADD